MNGEDTRSDAEGHEKRPRGRPGALVARLAVVIAVALGPLPGRAQTANGAPGAPSGGTFDGILHALDLKATPGEPPDFVRQTRPGSTDFIPVGRAHADRPLKVLTPEEVQAQTDSLDKARTAQQRAAGIKPPPIPLKAPKTAAPPRKTKLP